jgi:hypothetical protein
MPSVVHNVKSVSVSAIWLPPSSYWRLCNFDFCAACPMNSEAKV